MLVSDGLRSVMLKAALGVRRTERVYHTKALKNRVVAEALDHAPTEFWRILSRAAASPKR